MGIFKDLGFVNRNGKISAADSASLGGKTFNDIVNMKPLVLDKSSTSTLFSFALYNSTTRIPLTLTQPLNEGLWKKFEFVVTNLNPQITSMTSSSINSVTVDLGTLSNYTADAGKGDVAIDLVFSDYTVLNRMTFVSSNTNNMMPKTWELYIKTPTGYVLSDSGVSYVFSGTVNIDMTGGFATEYRVVIKSDWYGNKGAGLLIGSLSFSYTGYTGVSVNGKQISRVSYDDSTKTAVYSDICETRTLKDIIFYGTCYTFTHKLYKDYGSDRWDMDSYILENFNNATTLINDIFEDSSCVTTLPLDGNTHNLKKVVDAKYFKTIYGNSPVASDRFGQSCAIGNDFFLIGSIWDDDKGTDAGKVEMFSLDGTYIKTIYGSNPAASDNFGISCAIGNDFFLVGSAYDDDRGADTGKVEMFSLDGTFIKTIYSNSPAASDYFGSSIAIGSDFFLVGSHTDDDKGSNAGKVEMFSLDGTYIKTIYSNSPAAGNTFGASCAIGSDFFLVGSHANDDKATDAGKVEMFSLDGTYIKTIHSNNPSASDYFGASCAIGNDFILVGSHVDDDKATDAGKVEMFVIVKEDMKDKYKEVVYEKTIYSNNPAANDYFGGRVAIGTDFFLVGSHGDDDQGSDAGKVEMFTLDGTYIKTIYSNNPAANDRFGLSIAIGSDFFLVGSAWDDDKGTDAGKVEMFALDGTYIKTIYSNSPSAGDNFGQSCAIGTDFFLVGSHGDDDQGSDAGKVEMFTLDGTYIKTIYSNNPAANDRFGQSCAIGTDFFLVGSHGDDDKGTDAGKVEMFSLDGTYIKTIYSSNPSAGDNFGGSIAIGNDFFLVGSYRDDDKGTDAGKIEMFTLDGTYIKTIYSNNPAAYDLLGVSCAIGHNFILVGSQGDDDKGTDAGKVEMFRLGDITTPLNVTYSTGKFGQAAVFNGSNSIIELTTMSQTFFKDSSFTVSMWVKHHNVSHSNSYFGVYESDSANKSLQLMSYNGNQLYFAFYTYDLIYNWTPNINEWYFLTFSFNSNTKDRQIFINGELVKSDISPYNFQGTAVPKIGKSQTYQNMDGQIDQVRIFNRALTAAEVTKLYTENGSVTLTQEAGQDNWSEYQVVATNINGTIIVDGVEQVVETISEISNGDTIVKYTTQLVDTNELTVSVVGSVQELSVNLWVEE